MFDFWAQVIDNLPKKSGERAFAIVRHAGLFLPYGFYEQKKGVLRPFRHDLTAMRGKYVVNDDTPAWQLPSWWRGGSQLDCPEDGDKRFFLWDNSMKSKTDYAARLDNLRYYVTMI